MTGRWQRVDEYTRKFDVVGSGELYYWQREKNGSQAEIDYLIQKENKIIPIEVKSGTTGKMQSLHLFMYEKQSEYGIRTSLENFGQYNQIRVYPLYAIRQIMKWKHLYQTNGLP